jgi:hypothetical protein
LSPPFQIPIFEHFDRAYCYRSQIVFLHPLPSPRTAQAPRQCWFGSNFRLQDVVAGLFAGHCFQPLHEQHSQPFLIFDGVVFAAPRAEPVMLDGVPMGRLFGLLRCLLKAKQTPLPVIKIGGAIRVGAFQVHKLMFRRLVHRLPQIEQKSKIPAGAKPVKLNKQIQRIRATMPNGEAFSVSRIVHCVTGDVSDDCPAFRVRPLELARANKDFTTEDTESTEKNLEKRGTVRPS